MANAAGLPVEAATADLRGLSSKGWVEPLDSGPFGGWSVTDAGRTADQEMLEAELGLTGAGEPVRACYQSFLSLNPTPASSVQRLANAKADQQHSRPQRSLRRRIRLRRAHPAYPGQRCGAAGSRSVGGASPTLRRLRRPPVDGTGAVYWWRGRVRHRRASRVVSLCLVPDSTRIFSSRSGSHVKRRGRIDKGRRPRAWRGAGGDVHH